MSAQQSDYIVTTTRQRNKWQPNLGKPVEGWDVGVHDNITGSDVTVFVPGEILSLDRAVPYIEAYLTPLREVHAIGQ